MSAEATTWALRQTVGHPTTKLVLLILADVAGQDHTSWYGQARLAEMAEVSPRSIRTHLTKLEELGLLKRSKRRHAEMGIRITDVYELQVDQRKRASGSPAEAGFRSPAEAGFHQTVRENRKNTLSISPTDEQPSLSLTPPSSNGTPKASKDDFEKLWSVCRRGSKKKAWDEYRKAVPSKVTAERIHDAWESYTADREERYTKHLERWIRDEMWEQEAPREPVKAVRYY